MGGERSGALVRETGAAYARPLPRTHTPHPRSGLPAADVRLGPEVATRSVLAFGVRTAGRLTGRVVVDAAIIGAAAMLVRSAAWPTPATPIGASSPSVISALLVTLLALAAAGAYGISSIRSQTIAVPLVACAILALVFPVLTADGSHSWHGLSWLLTGVVSAALLAVAVVRRTFAHRRGERGTYLRGALLVGRERDLTTAVLALDGVDRQHVVDRLTTTGRRGTTPTIEQLTRRLASGDVREVVLVSPTRTLALRTIAETCWRAGVRCFVAFDAREVRSEPGLPTSIAGYPASELVPRRLHAPRLLVKRALDIVLALLLLPIALPLCAVIAIAIRIESRGHVIYRQRRVGLGGREFTIWKFRSMHGDARRHAMSRSQMNHYGDAPLFKLRNDPRITRVGRLLRRTSLDELPQLVNVLRGEMSLVGPRPPLPEEVARYASHHLVRLSVVPGMTGPWQVGGRNLITDFEEIVRMERAYIEEWSLALDLRIMARTVGVVVAGTGAY